MFDSVHFGQKTSCRILIEVLKEIICTRTIIVEVDTKISTKDLEQKYVVFKYFDRSSKIPDNVRLAPHSPLHSSRRPFPTGLSFACGTIAATDDATPVQFNRVEGKRGVLI